MNIAKLFISIAYPQANKQTEVTNRIIVQVLRTMIFTKSGKIGLNKYQVFCEPVELPSVLPLGNTFQQCTVSRQCYQPMW